MLIDVRQLRRVYRMGETEVVALAEIDLQVEAGEFISIMGPSGSGKSTFMHLLGCLERPSSGRYILDGVAVESLDDKELSRLRNRQVGFVFQNFNLIAQLNVLENIELPMLYSGTKREERRERARRMLETVKLSHRAEHRPNELSGGERQRIAIARSLVNEPSLILADEPTGNLDTKTGREILKIFQELHELGTTLLMVTHDAEVAKWSERIVRMRDGRLESDTGSTRATARASGSGGWREQS